MMQSFYLLLAVSASVLATPNPTADPGCNRDNCLRAVIASAFTEVQGAADCSSYLETTVTPPPVTVTATAAISKTDAGIEKRQTTVDSSAIPTYASACSGSVRYSSACSCVGVTQTTISAPTPTITVTASPSSTCSTFLLKAKDGPGAGNFAVVDDAGDGNNVIDFTTDPSTASSFSLDNLGHIQTGSGPKGPIQGNTNKGQSATYLFYFNTAEEVASLSYSYAYCQISADNTVTCKDQGATQFQICRDLTYAGAGVVLGAEVSSSCTAFDFEAVC